MKYKYKAAGWKIITDEPNKKVLETVLEENYYFDKVFQGDQGAEITLQGKTQIITQGTVTEAYTSSFPLEEIDDLREYILSKGRQQVRVGKESDEKLKSLFIYPLLVSPNPEKEGTIESHPTQNPLS